MKINTKPPKRRRRSGLKIQIYKKKRKRNTMKVTEVNIEWTSEKGQHYFAYYLDFIKENSRSIYAKGIYGDIYRVEKTSKKVYINGKFSGVAVKFYTI